MHNIVSLFLKNETSPAASGGVRLQLYFVGERPVLEYPWMMTTKNPVK